MAHVSRYSIREERSRCAHTVGESHGELEEAALPDRLLLSGDAAFPDLKVQHALGILLRLSIETKRVILPPLLPDERT